MKIELKKVQIFDAMSEETTAFHAELYVNGKNIGFAKNAGHGGSTDCHAHYDKPECKELFKQAEQYCLGLPPIKVPAKQGPGFEYPMDLETFVDELIEQELIKKANKKLEKKMVDTIMWGVPNSNSYTQVKFKVPLSKIPTLQLQVWVNKYKKEFTQGQMFLNTNLVSLGIKL